MHRPLRQLSCYKYVGAIVNQGRLSRIATVEEEEEEEEGEEGEGEEEGSCSVKAVDITSGRGTDRCCYCCTTPPFRLSSQ